MLSKIIQGTRCFTYDEYQIPERPNPFIFNILCQPVNEKKHNYKCSKLILFIFANGQSTFRVFSLEL